MTAPALSVAVCLVGERHYAVPVEDIVEVAALVRVTPIPEAPAEVLGVVNRRGVIVPILDLRLCFGQKIGPLDLTTLFVVVQGPPGMAGLVVDDVLEVRALPAGALRQPAKSGPYIRGIAAAGPTPLLVLDVAALLRAYAPADLPVWRER